ncbi:MAG TPA: hypothetical protein VFK79_10760 [Xanthobacteraceae bacterium]|nr:hypothetical protein [Xanthobacteraceae bacterium]
MTPAEQYRVKANEFLVLANGEANPELQVEYARMAQSYLRLADLAERNSQTDIVYETPPAKEPPAPTA